MNRHLYLGTIIQTTDAGQLEIIERAKILVEHGKVRFITIIKLKIAILYIKIAINILTHTSIICINVLFICI